MPQLRSQPLLSRPLRSKNNLQSDKNKKRNLIQNKSHHLNSAEKHLQSIASRLKNGQISKEEAHQQRLDLARSLAGLTHDGMSLTPSAKSDKKG